MNNESNDPFANLDIEIVNEQLQGLTELEPTSIDMPNRIQINPPPPPPSVRLPSSTYAQMINPFNTAGLIQRVLQERSVTPEVDPDENYVNFEELEDVKITLTPQALDNLETIIDFTRISTCMICWEPIMDEAIELPCQHYYHETCIKTWLTNFSYTCPICKQIAGEKEAHL